MAATNAAITVNFPYRVGNNKYGSHLQDDAGGAGPAQRQHILNPL
jgi:hypothetical protein